MLLRVRTPRLRRARKSRTRPSASCSRRYDLLEIEQQPYDARLCLGRLNRPVMRYQNSFLEQAGQRCEVYDGCRHVLARRYSC